MVTAWYSSTLGDILLGDQANALAGLWFVGQVHFPTLPDAEMGTTATLELTKKWLDLYFSGEIPPFLPPLFLEGTPFQKQVWMALAGIPYGQVLSYGALAQRLDVGSAQAVGSAVARNPISLILPCHRVVGSKGQLTGYAGGLERKAWLLDLERSTLHNSGFKLQPSHPPAGV